jgi:hypothetical protein
VEKECRPGNCWREMVLHQRAEQELIPGQSDCSRNQEAGDRIREQNFLLQQQNRYRHGLRLQTERHTMPDEERRQRQKFLAREIRRHGPRPSRLRLGTLLCGQAHSTEENIRSDQRKTSTSLTSDRSQCMKQRQNPRHRRTGIGIQGRIKGKTSDLAQKQGVK